MKKDFRPILCLALIALLVSACIPAQASAPSPPAEPPASPTSSPNQLAPSGADTRLPTPTAMVSGALGAKINDYIRTNFPLFSGSLLVAQSGQVVLSGGYFFSNWELESPNYPDTIFRLSSLSKPFTALAILMLAERGQLSLSEPICSFIADCPPAWQPITIHQLLTHASGIPDYSKLPAARQAAATAHSPAEMVAMFWQEPLEFTPGEQFSYSNSGYILLGAIIEVVSRGSYEDFLSANIFRPLAMQDSGYDHNARILKSRATGYTVDGRALENAIHIDASNLYAAAGLYSTVEDLYRWTQALYTEQLVSASTLREMFTSRVATPAEGVGYGYGWYVSQSGGRRMVAHDGKIPGFHNFLAHYPEDGVDIIILSNLDTTDVRAMARGIEEIVFQRQE